MSASAGPILPVINVPVNYDEEREKIRDFLEHFKAPASSVPPLSRVGAAPVRGPLIAPDAGVDGAEDDESMQVDAWSTTEAGGAAPDAAVTKYMVQLVRPDAHAATHCES